MLNRKVPPSTMPPRPDDMSFKIDTKSTQFAMCPQCMEELPLAQLNRHMTKQCSCIVIKCPMHGCNSRFAQSDLKRHLERECSSMKKRKKMELNAETRKLEITSAAYASKTKTTTVSDSRLAEMRAEIQAQYLGTDNIASNEDVTDIEGENSDMNALTLHGEVQCPDCQDTMRPSELPYHREEECLNRLILCPNRFLGCMESVRLSDIRKHLRNSCIVEKHKDEMLMRSKLRRELITCVGCGLDVPLKDIRKHDNDYCANRYVPCRNWALGCQVMVRMQEKAKHEYVDGSFKVRPCLYMSGGDSHILIGEDDVPAPWTAEYWVYLPRIEEAIRRQLMGVISRRRIFRKAFLVERMTNLKVIELTKAMEEMAGKPGDAAPNKAERKRITEERLAVMDTIAGLVATYENVAMDTVEASLKLNISLNAVISMLVEIMPTQPTGAAALPPRPPGVAEQEAIEEQKERVRKIEEARERRFALAAEKARLLEEKRLREEEEAAVREALGLDSPDDSPRLSIRKETNSVVAEDPNTHEDSEEIHGDAALVDSVDGDDFSSGNEGVEVENILDVETEDATGDENNSDFPVVSSEKGAAVNSETARGEISDPDNALARDPNQSADAPSAENKIVPPNGSDNLAAGGDDGVGCKEANEDVPEESKHDEEEEISCPELGDDPVIDTRVTKQWVDWMDFIMAIRDNFGRELAVLLEWRTASGLVAKDVHLHEEEVKHSHGKKKADKKKLTEKERKKEKAKLRREEKSKKKKKGNTGDNDSDSKFRFRVANAIKTIHGTDVLCSSPNSPNKLCLNIHNDVSQNNHFHVSSENIKEFPGVHHIPVIDLKKGTNLPPSGKIGIICEKTGPYVFDVTLPRQQWVHVAYVCTNRPKKKISMYVGGVAIGHIKDITFTLPLNAIGEAEKKSNDSFHGCFMDIRLWKKARSALEISKGLHSLIEIVKEEAKYKILNRSITEGTRPGTASRPATVESESNDDAQPQPVASRRHGRGKNVKPAPAFDMTSRGMVGWWTFEDGMFNHISDVTEQRFKVSVVSTTARVNLHQNAPVSGTLTMKYIIDPARPADYVPTEDDPPITSNKIPRLYSHVWMDADYGVPLSQQALGKAVKESATWEFNKLSHGAGATLPDKTEEEGGASAQGNCSLLPIPSFKNGQVCPFELRRFRLAVKGRALMREVDCPQKCGEKIRQTDIRFHTSFECMNRIVMCRFAPICTEKFEFHFQAEHESDPRECWVRTGRDRVLARAAKHNLEIPCKHCSEKIRARDLDRHENDECVYRNVPCPREDCGEMVQAHLLKDHMKYSCSSKMYHRRMWLIRRGRKRKNYARPWGIEIPLNDSDEEGDDSSVEYGTHSMSRPTTGNTQRDTRSSPEAGVFGSPNTARATSASSRPSGSPSRPEVSS